MRGKSHTELGNYLIWQYMPDIPSHYKSAFLLGCVQPDKNPATYLKGSLRHQWLRGHNYLNARRFMVRLSRRLEKKSSLRLVDYYTLGKLIHYTADAFTAAHNEFFKNSLRDHRQYEASLQQYFLTYLHSKPVPDGIGAQTIMEGINSCHREYRTAAADVRRDSLFALKACCCILAVLLSPRVVF